MNKNLLKLIVKLKRIAGALCLGILMLASVHEAGATCVVAPSAPDSVYGNRTVCASTIQTYSVTAVSGATSYKWMLPFGWSGSSTTNSISLRAGTVSGVVSVTAINDCGNSDTTLASITVNTIPLRPTFISGPTSVCKASTQTFGITSV